jgi:hypothetical protein
MSNTSNRVMLITPEDEPFSGPSIQNLRRLRTFNIRKMYCNICLTLFSYLCWATIFFNFGILVCVDALTFNSSITSNSTIIIFNNDIPLKNLVILDVISSIIFVFIFMSQIVIYFKY